MKQKSLFITIGSLSLMFLATVLYFNSHGELLRMGASTPELFTTEAMGPSGATDSEDRIPELGEAEQADKPKEEHIVALNDPALSEKWDLQKTDAMRAWRISEGSRDIIVAVIDTGCDTNHEDLANNFWVNPGEMGVDSKGNNKQSNGIDDDGNGFVDDIYGWNFVNNNNDVSDSHGHGTHIAGIIGAEAGNGKGIAGIAPKVSMMCLKYYDHRVAGVDHLRNTIDAINYAVDMGAHIINYSGGGLEYSQEEMLAIDRARQRGILFVAAAGNERSNSDEKPYYPADYRLSNIISVTAIDPQSQVLASSNYGEESVHIAAPGQNIMSTLPGSKYGYMTGTSQATAFVTGAAAVVMAHRQNFVAEDVRRYILATGDQLSSLISKTRTARRLNLYKALTIFDADESASGVVAANVSSGMRRDFSSDPEARRDEVSRTDPLAFGRSLLEAIDREPAQGDLR